MKFSTKPLNEVEIATTTRPLTSKWAPVREALKAIPYEEALIVDPEEMEVKRVVSSIASYLKRFTAKEEFTYSLRRTIDGKVAIFKRRKGDDDYAIDDLIKKK